LLREPSRLLSVADAALYDAKTQGRNRILFRSLAYGIAAAKVVG
jgi:hypothetical protein